MRVASLAVALGMMLILAGIVGAEEASPPRDGATSQPKVLMGPKVLTGKERLGEKWMDEQRLDNCKVPPEKRGPKPRPDKCADAPTG